MSKKHKKQDKHDKTGVNEDGTGRAAAPTSEAAAPSDRSLSREEYEAQLHLLQVELVKLQRHFIRCQDRILVVLEGRDAAGKDGSIKRIVEYLSPRETRVVALGKPSDRERSGWYFQRYVPHLPSTSARTNRSSASRSAVATRSSSGSRARSTQWQ
jgi:polyphosphate kinase 2 (PPK2 family)